MNSNSHNNPENLFDNNSENTGNEHMISLSDVLHLIKNNWSYFVISTLLAVAGGWLYIKSVPSEYERSASVLVNSPSGMSGPLADMMKLSNEDLGLGITDKVENELFIFRTHKMISRVVDQLNLRISYRKKSGLVKEQLYKDSPISLTLLDVPDNFSGSFNLSFLENRKLRLSDFDGGFEKLFPQKELIISESEIIKTPIGSFLLTPSSSSVETEAPIAVKVESKEKTITSFSRAIKVFQMSKGSSIINLQLNHENPILAEDFLNTLIAEHEIISKSEKLKIARNTEAFINDRIAIIGKELGDVDEQIERFKQSNQIADMGSEAEIYIESSKEITKQTIDINNALAIAHFLKEYLENPANEKNLIPANSGLEDFSSKNLISEYNTLFLYREQLLSESGNNNPLIETQQKQLESLRKAIVKSIDNYINSLDIKLLSINKQSNKNERKISSVPMQERIIGSILRNQKIKEELFLFLLNAREKNALSIEGTEADLRLIQPAVGSSIPVAPKKLIIMLVAAVLGILIPSIFIYLRFILNSKVRGRKDLELYTQIPILGEIPHSDRLEKKQNVSTQRLLNLFRNRKNRVQNKRYQRRSNMLLGKTDERDFVSEAFSVLRTNMSFMLLSQGDRKEKVISLTSAIPNSGKTFIAANMAHSLATLASKRVLLIDADIRKGSLTSALRASLSRQSMGLSAYLSQENLSIDEVIVPSSEEIIFDFLPAGTIPPNPTELLLSSRLDQLIDELRPKYDYIIIDTVPFLNMADSQVTSRTADLTIMVVREGNLPRVLLKEINMVHKNRYFGKLALVLNDAGVSERISGRNYGYQSYSYGYKSYFDQK